MLGRLARSLLRAPPPRRLQATRCASSISDSVSLQIKDAMRAKDGVRLAALRNCRAAFLVAMKETNADSIEDAKAVEVLRRLVKQRAESIAGFRSAGREEQAAAEEAEKALIESFLPSLASLEVTEGWVREAIAALGASKPGDAGKVMGAVNKAHKGDVDNLLLKSVVERLLAA
jgi:hypothetical protein